MKTLFVTRDFGPAQILEAVASSLIQNGHEVQVIAEEVSKEKSWPQNQFAHLGEVESRSSLNEGEVLEVLHDEQWPDVVCLGSSSPINWELLFAQAANEIGIPVVAVSDVFGGLKHLGEHGVKVDLALETTNLGMEIDARAGRFDRAVVIGHPMTSNIKRLLANPPDGLQAAVNTAKEGGRKLLVVVGQMPDATLDMIRVAGECVRRNPSQWSVAIRLHPKFKTDDYLSKVSALTASFGETRLVTFDPKYPTDPIIALSDGVLTGYSTALQTAMLAGKTAFAVATDRIVQDLMGESELSRWPLWDSGATVMVPEGGMNFLPEIGKDRPAATEFCQSLKWRPEVAVAAIESQ